MKNQRATVADSFTERNKNSLLGISKSGGAAIATLNNSTMDQRHRMQGGQKISNLSQIIKQAGQGSINDQEREHKFPMDPRTALFQYQKHLLDFEKTEILEYDAIYFLPINDRKQNKNHRTPDGVENNGFDNDKNEYITQEGNHIAYRFEITNGLGKGSFGQVFKCFDHKN